MNMGGKSSGKVNVDAMQTNISQRMKEAKSRERLLQKLTDKRMFQAQAQAQMQGQMQAQDEEEIFTEQQPIKNLVFSKGEAVERSTREPPKKKKKNKNKK